jgi:hypothetical protein
MSAAIDAHLNDEALGGPEKQVDEFITPFNLSRNKPNSADIGLPTISLKQNTYNVEYCDGNERIQVYADAFTLGGALWDVMERYNIKVRKIG